MFFHKFPAGGLQFSKENILSEMFQNEFRDGLWDMVS